MMEEKRMAQLDPRLERVADFVRPGALFADVGCDHGHLSVELMRRGAQRGFACDIKEGPLQAAKRNLEKAGFAERVQTVLTDGLAGMEQSGVTDVVIAGIGGEVISGILERAPFLQQEGIRLVLQPQTREQVLRDFLANNGFAVIEEEVVSSGKYLYVVMVAEYTGCCRSISLMEKFCGKLTDNCTPQACEKLRMTACHLAERSKGLFQEGEAALAAEYLQTSGEILSLIGSFYL